jgi:hypothetical protein
MKSFINSKKRWLVAGIAAATLAGGAYAFAASITVSSTTLGAGSTTVAACNSTAAVSYSTAWDAGHTQFDVNTVTVTSAASCSGMDVDVYLTGSNTDLGHHALDVNGSYTWGPLPPGVVVAASAVTDAHVAITG